MLIAGALCAAGLLGDASAQTGPGLLIAPFEPDKNYELNGSAVLLDRGESDNGGGDFQLFVYDAWGRMRLDLDEFLPGVDRAQPRAGFEVTFLDVDDDAGVVPANLVDASVGLGIGVLSEGSWIAGLTVGVGYAGAGAFGDGDAWYGKADLVVGYQIDDEQQVGVVINYDGNRSFMPDVPLPGVIYRRRVDSRFDIGVGFPFSDITWRPVGPLTLKLTYFIPEDLSFEAEYKIGDSFAVFAGFLSRNEAFHSNDLDNNLDRILFQQTRAELGVRGTINETVSLSLAGGFAFNQQFDVGFDTRNADELAEISDEPYVRLAVEARF
jgi:hypothetical protein